MGRPLRAAVSSSDREENCLSHVNITLYKRYIIAASLNLPVTLADGSSVSRKETVFLATGITPSVKLYSRGK